MATKEKKIDINEEALSDDELKEVSGGQNVTVTGQSKNVGSQKKFGANKFGSKKLAGSDKLNNSHELAQNNKDQNDLDFNF